MGILESNLILSCEFDNKASLVTIKVDGRSLYIQRYIVFFNLSLLF